MTTFKQFMVEAEGEKLAVAMAQKMLNSMVDEVPNIPEQVSQGAKHHGHKFVDTASGPWIVTHYKNGDSEFVKVEPPKGSEKHPMFFLPRGTPNMNEATFEDDQVELDHDLTKWCHENDVTFSPRGAHALVKFQGSKANLVKMINKFWGEPEDYVDMISEGAVKHAIMDIIEKAVRSAKHDPNYTLTLNHIAQEVRRLDKNELTAGMTQKQVRDLIKPLYDESDHNGAMGKHAANRQHASVKESVDILDEATGHDHTKHMEFQRAARMDSFIGHVYSSKQFSYHADDKTFTSEISETKDVLKRAWNDSADQGFGIRSDKTDNVVVFTLLKEHKDREGDITHWDFEVYNPRRYPELKGLKATVFND